MMARSSFPAPPASEPDQGGREKGGGGDPDLQVGWGAGGDHSIMDTRGPKDHRRSHRYCRDEAVRVVDNTLSHQADIACTKREAA